MWRFYSTVISRSSWSHRRVSSYIGGTRKRLDLSKEHFSIVPISLWSIAILQVCMLLRETNCAFVLVFSILCIFMVTFYLEGRWRVEKWKRGRGRASQELLWWCEANTFWSTISIYVTAFQEIGNFCAANIQRVQLISRLPFSSCLRLIH